MDFILKIQEVQNAEYIKEVKTITDKILKSASKSVTDYGSGGMITKIEAAKICGLRLPHDINKRICKQSLSN